MLSKLHKLSQQENFPNYVVLQCISFFIFLIYSDMPEMYAQLHPTHKFIL